MLNRFFDINGGIWVTQSLKDFHNFLTKLKDKIRHFLELKSQFSDGQSIFIKFFRNFTDPYYYAVRGELLISVHRYF